MVKIISAIIEIIGITVVSTGIGLELAFKADIYWLLITGGSLIVASGGMLYAKVSR